MSETLKALVPLAEGVEEIEGIVTIDVLRRAGLEVIVAGVGAGPVKASRGTVHIPDAELNAVLDEPFDIIILPGGRPGADHLAAEEALLKRLRRQQEEGGWLAAICAAPIVFQRAGLLEGRRYTCHPSAAEEIESGQRDEARVCVDGKLITAQGAGVSFEFALTIVQHLKGADTVSKINAGLLCHETALPHLS